MKEKVAIVIPTYNNYNFLVSCIDSILSTDFVAGLFHIYVVNNGHKSSCDFLKNNPKITVFDQVTNLGWEGGLKYGIENTTEDFILFMNDDTYVPVSSSGWLQKMLNHFNRTEKIGIVAPSSNTVMGYQNIFLFDPLPLKYVNYLIFFCALVSRKALTEVGGIDDTLPGGDDIDLSIRMRNKGYSLIADRSIFVYHHGFKTGDRLHGTYDKPFGWNSPEFTERTNFALIRKHGFRKWFETLFIPYKHNQFVNEYILDSEGDIIRGMNLQGKIVELGCGPLKTIKDSIGVDIIGNGKLIDSLTDKISIADIEADVSKPLPFEEESIDVVIGRHIFEHILDPILTLRQWKKVLKVGGKLVLALPNEEINRTIPMNFEHKHAYTQYSIGELLKISGFEVKEIIDPKNHISFIISAIKI